MMEEDGGSCLGGTGNKKIFENNTFTKSEKYRHITMMKLLCTKFYLV